MEKITTIMDRNHNPVYAYAHQNNTLNRFYLESYKKQIGTVIIPSISSKLPDAEYILGVLKNGQNLDHNSQINLENYLSGYIKVTNECLKDMEEAGVENIYYNGNSSIALNGYEKLFKNSKVNLILNDDLTLYKFNVNFGLTREGNWHQHCGLLIADKELMEHIDEIQSFTGYSLQQYDGKYINITHLSDFKKQEDSTKQK